MKYLKTFENFVPKQLADREEKAVKMGLRITDEDKASIKKFVYEWLADRDEDLGMMDAEELTDVAEKFEDEHSAKDFEKAGINSIKYHVASEYARALIMGLEDMFD